MIVPNKYVTTSVAGGEKANQKRRIAKQNRKRETWISFLGLGIKKTHTHTLGFPNRAIYGKIKSYMQKEQSLYRDLGFAGED